MNVLEATIAHLSASLGVPASSNVPAKRPGAFVTVERGGGSVTQVDDEAQLTVQVWDRDRLEIEGFADRACDALLCMPHAVRGVMSVKVEKTYYPEQVDGYWPRYVVSATVYCSR